MIYIVVSVFDTASSAYMRPFYAHAVGQATRTFQDEVNRPGEDNPMYRHPEDFLLFSLGAFDDQTGILSALSTPQLLARAMDLKV